jgi:serine/threonine protein kinase
MLSELNALQRTMCTGAMSNISPIKVEGESAAQTPPVHSQAETLLLETQCSHIVSFLGAFADPSNGSVSLVLEYMDAGSLQVLVVMLLIPCFFNSRSESQISLSTKLLLRI